MSFPAVKLSPLRIALIYIILGALWIVFSDFALAMLLSGTFDRSSLLGQTVKGWGFVFLSGILIWALVRQLTSKLKTSNQALQVRNAAIENTHNGVAVTDQDQRIIYVNRAFTEISGYSEAEILGNTPRMFKSGKHDEAFYRAFWQALNETNFWQGEMVNRRKDGSLFTEWITVSRVEDASTGDVQFISILSDVSQAKSSKAELRYLALHDPLTDLPNRLQIKALLKNALGRTIPVGQQKLVGFLFIGLDDFKVVNGTLGHEVGDLVLKQTARRLRQCLSGEQLGRFGGDQFVIIMPAADSPYAISALADRILNAFSRSMSLESGRQVGMRLSIGITFCAAGTGDDDKHLSILFSQADSALDEAKRRGKNAYAFYSEEMTVKGEKRLRLEQGLQVAVQRNEMRLYYQPVFDVHSGRLVGSEALVRWQHPHWGLIPPGDFIALAEETGQIVPLGWWVIREAVRQTRHWLDQGLEPGYTAVNISSRQLANSNFTDLLQQVLAQSGLEPQRLEVELTESVLMGLGDDTTTLLSRIRASGVGLAIDDFGTGYSSLSYLKRFPVGKLKIDRSFIMEVEEGDSDRRIVQAIIAMSRALNLRVQAEGVEHQGQLQILQSLGCDTYQGFLRSPPVPADQYAQQFLEPARPAISARQAR